MLILYNPPSSNRRKPVLPMSLLALGALLEGAHQYRIIDGNLESDPLAAINRAVDETGADLLAVTVMPGPQLNHSVPLCRRLKQLHPRLTIVWGGYFPTQHYEACLRAEYVDYVVRGHGEGVFQRLTEGLKRGDDVTTLPGLAYRHPATGQPVSNPMAPLPDPDRLPDFPYHRVEMPRYVRSSFLGKRTAAHHSSYGCPFSCSFCAVVNMAGSRWVAQSAERTARTAAYLVEKWGADAVEFYDNNFFVHEGRTSEFAERVTKLSIAWWGEARVDTLLSYSDRSWTALQDSGLKMVFMGAEAGSDETLRQMNKGGTASVEKTLAIVEKMAHHGIVPELSFVVGSPPDPESDVRRTLEFVRAVKRANPQTEIVLYLYTPVPLSGELYDRAREEGFRFPETLEEWVSPDWEQFSERRSGHLPWVKDPLRQQLRDFERVLNARYPTATDPRLRGVWRGLLQGAGAWRYQLRFYHYPLELRVLQRLLGYQRPETSGF